MTVMIQVLWLSLLMMTHVSCLNYVVTANDSNDDSGFMAVIVDVTHVSCLNYVVTANDNDDSGFMAVIVDDDSRFLAELCCY
jgi:hypothetical protein